MPLPWGIKMSGVSVRSAVGSFADRHRGAAGFVAGVGTFVVLAAGSVALAAVPSASGNFSACSAKPTGRLRLIDAARGAKCSSTETSVGWSRAYSNRGVWNASRAYAAGDVVRSGAESFVALTASRATRPVAGRTWGLLATGGARGSAGPTGATGAAGPAGAIGPTGATGAAGATGPTGVRGATGATGTPGLLAHYQRVSGPFNVVTFGGDVGAVADCPLGTRLLGGGSSIESDQYNVYKSYPDTTVTPPRWVIQVANGAPFGSPSLIQAYALCA